MKTHEPHCAPLSTLTQMFFVCEMCYEKQSSDGEQGPWPYTISKQSEQTNRVAAKLIPLAKGALLAGKAVNGVAGIGKLMVRY